MNTPIVRTMPNSVCSRGKQAVRTDADLPKNATGALAKLLNQPIGAWCRQQL